MRKNAPRKWLHAILDLLPVILIPVFMIYSHRHIIDSGSIQVPQNQVVDFNQQFSPSDYSHSELSNTINITIQEKSPIIDIVVTETSTDNVYFQLPVPQFVNGNKYYFKFIPPNENLIPYVYKGSTFINLTNSQIITFNNDFSSSGLIFEPSTVGHYIYYFNIIDLTQMFGVGNEPTVQQFETLYDASYYNYTLSLKELLQVGNTTYDDTDIMSQVVYQLYNSVDKYFNMNNVFNMGAVYDWFVINIFNGNAPLIMSIVWNIALYELVMDLMFLLYALFMWFVDWCKSLIERTYDVGRGK